MCCIFFIMNQIISHVSLITFCTTTGSMPLLVGVSSRWYHDTTGFVVSNSVLTWYITFFNKQLTNLAFFAKQWMFYTRSRLPLLYLCIWQNISNIWPSKLFHSSDTDAADSFVDDTRAFVCVQKYSFVSLIFFLNEMHS